MEGGYQGEPQGWDGAAAPTEFLPWLVEGALPGRMIAEEGPFDPFDKAVLDAIEEAACDVLYRPMMKQLAGISMKKWVDRPKVYLGSQPQAYTGGAYDG